MKLLISGGRGFLGSALVRALAARHHAIVILSRTDRPAVDGIRTVAWTPDGSASGAWAREVADADAIVNLAGAGIADKRWTDARKRDLLDSRLGATRSLVAAIKAAPARSRAFISGSAVGYYGTSASKTFDESSPAGGDFLADVCRQWETAALDAAKTGGRVVLLRTGVVLDRRGGALKKMLLPFQLGAGGPIGNGRQWMSWIHLDDWVSLVSRAIDDASISGPLNVVAPQPVTNADFSHALGRALHRPAFMPTPPFLLRLLFGEMADVALIRGQRVIPTRAEAAGVRFTYSDIVGALDAAVARRSRPSP